MNNFKDRPSNHKRIVILYLVLVHLALLLLTISIILLASDRGKLDQPQTERIVKLEGFRRCIDEGYSALNCSNLDSWYVSHFYKDADGTLIYGNHYGIRNNNGFLTYVVISPDGKILK